MKPKHPQPVAYCWYRGKEMSKWDIERKRCTDPEKQIDGMCKWLQRYGYRVKPILMDREEGRDEMVSVREVRDKPDHDNR